MFNISKLKFRLESKARCKGLMLLLTLYCITVRADRSVISPMIHLGASATSPVPAEISGPSAFDCDIRVHLEYPNHGVLAPDLTPTVTLNFIFMKLGFSYGLGTTNSSPGWSGGSSADMGVDPNISNSSHSYRAYVNLSQNFIWGQQGTYQSMTVNVPLSSTKPLKADGWQEWQWTAGCNLSRTFTGNCSIPFVHNPTLLGIPWLNNVPTNMDCNVNNATCTAEGEIAFSVRVTIPGDRGSVIGEVSSMCRIERGNTAPIYKSTPIQGGHAF